MTPIHSSKHCWFRIVGKSKTGLTYKNRFVDSENSAKVLGYRMHQSKEAGIDPVANECVVDLARVLEFERILELDADGAECRLLHISIFILLLSEICFLLICSLVR